MRDDPTKHHPSSGRSAQRPSRKKFAPLSGPARQTAPVKPKEGAASAPQRIAKVIARAGACSRRDAEVWISEGRVALNGVVLTNPATNVTAADEIAIDGAPLAARGKTRLFLFHKPRGLVTTERDPEGRATIFDYLREHWPDAPRLVSVGRLDINTEGLLLLTNDGGLARVLELPSTGWVRRYRVRANGVADQAVLDQLRHGVTIDGVAYAEIEATLDRVQGANCWLTMALREGKNREIKRILEHLGLEVNRLIRLSFGPFQLGEIAEGALDEVKTRVLREQLGPALAEAAGADFSEPAAVATGPAGARPRPERRDDEARGDRGEKPGRRSASPEQRAGKSARPGPRAPSASRAPRAEQREKPTAGPRKHISALRAEISEQAGARKRTLRSETADRSGRAVPVERLVAVERPARRTRDDAPTDRRDAARPSTRNGRRFVAERSQREGAAERPARAPKREAPAEDRSSAPRGDASGARWRGAEAAAPGRAREAEKERPHGAGAKGKGRPQRPRGPYDPAKDRSRPDARRGAAAKSAEKRPGKPGGSRPEAASAHGQKRFGQGANPARPSSGFHSKNKGSRGAGGPDGAASRGPRRGPGGGPNRGPGRGTGRPRGKP